MSQVATPLILLAGQAGSGKDTVASYIAENYNGVCVAQADPMKSLVKRLFGFSDQQLWGPSDFRNAVDVGTLLPERQASQVLLSNLFTSYMNEILPGACTPDVMARAIYWYQQFVQREKLDKGEALSPRYVLQTLGTEFGRHVNKEMWSQHAIRTAQKLLSGGWTYDRDQGLVQNDEFPGYDFAIITDGRFRNEVISVAMVGGFPVLIVRPNANAKAVEAGGMKNHRSEAELGGIPRHFFHGIIKNDGSLDELYTDAREMMHDVYGAVLRRAA
jgi:hypothetical protein